MHMNKHPATLFLAQSAPFDVLSSDLKIYLMSDQPTTCPMCSHPTSWVGENPQLHTCTCGFEFCAEEDEDLGLVEVDGKWIPEKEAV